MAKKPLHVLIDEDIRKQMQQAAKEENRSLANLVETILMRWLEDRKRLISPP